MAEPTALTPGELATLVAIREYLDTNGFAPSMRELATMTGANSNSTVHNRINGLRAKGWIARVHNRSRAIVLLTPPPAGAPCQD